MKLPQTSKENSGWEHVGRVRMPRQQFSLREIAQVLVVHAPPTCASKSMSLSRVYSPWRGKEASVSSYCEGLGNAFLSARCSGREGPGVQGSLCWVSDPWGRARFTPPPPPPPSPTTTTTHTGLWTTGFLQPLRDSPVAVGIQTSHCEWLARPSPPCPIASFCGDTGFIPSPPPSGSSLELLFLRFLAWWPLPTLMSSLFLIPSFLILKFTLLPLEPRCPHHHYNYLLVCLVSSHAVREVTGCVLLHQGVQCPGRFHSRWSGSPWSHRSTLSGIKASSVARPFHPVWFQICWRPQSDKQNAILMNQLVQYTLTICSPMRMFMLIYVFMYIFVVNLHVCYLFILYIYINSGLCFDE